MTRIRSVLLVLVVACLALSSVASAKPTKGDILNIDKQWRDARTAQDFKAMDALMAPEFIAVDDHGDLRTRDEFLKWARSAKITSWNEPASEYTVKIHENVAVVSAKCSMTGSFVYKNGHKKLQLNTRSSRVYVNEGGAWKLALIQYVTRP